MEFGGADRVCESPRCRLNTLLLIPALFASDGGIERISRLYLRAVGELAAPGERVSAVVLNDRAISPAQLAPYQAPALVPPIACGRNKVACVWHALRISRHSSRVICTHVHLLRVALLARRFAPAMKIWLVAHGWEVWRDFTAAEQRRLRAAHKILCISDYTRGELMQRCPALPSSQLVVLPNGLDPQFEQATLASRPATPGVILSVARLVASESYKGVDHMIKSLPAIRTAVPAAHLRVIGDGDDRPRLETLARECGVVQHVTFAGRVSDAELQRSLAECQLFALPSRGEGFGLVYLEAMAHGRPCLAANAGGAPEVIDASSGILAPFGNVDAIAEAAIGALRREWDPQTVRRRAEEFSYPRFRDRLALALAA